MSVSRLNINTIDRCPNANCTWFCSHSHQHISHPHYGEKVAFSDNELSEQSAKGCRYCGILYKLLTGVPHCRCPPDIVATEREEHTSQSLRVSMDRDAKWWFVEIEPPCQNQRTFHWRLFNGQGSLFTSCYPTACISPLTSVGTFTAQMNRAQGTLKYTRASPQSLALYLKWLTRCRREHDACRVTNDLGSPSRLLKILSSRIQLVDNSLKHPGEYCALSYCWGKEKPPMLKKDNYEIMTSKGIRYEELPLCYQDAVVIAKGLKLKYIWIDSLCIIQDNPHDFGLECAKMGGIFGDATITIVVSELHSVYESFIDRQGAQWTEDLEQYGSRVEYEFEMTGIDGEPSTVIAREYLHHWDDVAAYTPHAYRAWTFQERKLARRCLIFNKAETFWECHNICMCECTNPAQLKMTPQILPLKSDGPRATLEGCFKNDEEVDLFWRRNVEIYCGRRLTRCSDRLPALAGIASIVAQTTKDEYLAGLWRQNLLRQLIWRPTGRGNQPSKYLAPSWSWASLQAIDIVSYTADGVLTKDTYQAEVIEAHCERTGPDIYGSLRSGYVILRGLLQVALCTMYVFGPLQGSNHACDKSSVQEKAPTSPKGETFSDDEVNNGNDSGQSHTRDDMADPLVEFHFPHGRIHDEWLKCFDYHWQHYRSERQVVDHAESSRAIWTIRLNSARVSSSNYNFEFEETIVDGSEKFFASKQMDEEDFEEHKPCKRRELGISSTVHHMIHLFWLTEKCFLILGKSLLVPGAYHRLGLYILQNDCRNEEEQTATLGKFPVDTTRTTVKIV